ncbi:hypothetical protein FD755_022839, partial [Muntiacus reevesi]
SGTFPSGKGAVRESPGSTGSAKAHCGSNPSLLCLPGHWQVGSLPLAPPGKPDGLICCPIKTVIIICVCTYIPSLLNLPPISLPSHPPRSSQSPRAELPMLALVFAPHKNPTWYFMNRQLCFVLLFWNGAGVGLFFSHTAQHVTVVLMCFVVPTLVPWYIWGESLWNSYFLASILRYTISLNVTWLVNSVAHMYGNRPYDRHISPRQNPLVTLGAIGEGFHNYHHTFPFDYSASEFGLNFNPTTWFIDFMCWLGLATDRKRATKQMIEARKARTGDGSA